MKLLIADDDPVSRKLVEKHAINWGYEAVTAADGDQAWEVLKRDDAPRLAVLDWQMPGIDGVDVCRRVKEDSSRPFTYVVMLSGRDAKDDIVAGLDAGADDYLTKPVEPAILRSRLAAASRIVEAVPPKEWSMPRVPGYDVKRLIGKGAFATVWEASRVSDGLPMALKIIRVDLATDDVFGRFSREVRMMQQMNHPNIARVFDSRVDQKLGYCAMELIDGRTLDKYVLQEQPGVRKILGLVSQIGDALDHAHKVGVLHRDLKPSNIMVGADGTPKLVDFGLGKSMFRAEAEPDAGQTMVGSVVGTPLFMAPEQARGENSKLDGRTDVYALGVVLYVMLLRRHPHKVDNSDWRKTVQQIAKGRARPPSEFRRGFDPELERMMMKALADDRGERYQSAAEFAADLRRFVKERWKAAS